MYFIFYSSAKSKFQAYATKLTWFYNGEGSSSWGFLFKQCYLPSYCPSLQSSVQVLLQKEYNSQLPTRKIHKHYKSLQFHQKLNHLLFHRTPLVFCHERHEITTYTSKTIIKMCNHVTGLRGQYKAPHKVPRKSAHRYFFTSLALEKYYLKRHLFWSYSVCPGPRGLLYPYCTTATWLSLQILVLFWKKRQHVPGICQTACCC